MSTIKIVDKKTFIKYIKNVDSQNLKDYLKIIDFYKKNSIHDIYKLSFYILERMENKDIKNKVVYFQNSLKNNIQKLNDYSKGENNKNQPLWLDKKIEENIATPEEIAEMENLFKMSMEKRNNGDSHL